MAPAPGTTSALSPSRIIAGREKRGIACSDQVQGMNKKGDKDHDPSPSKGSKGKKTRTREGWEKNAKHRGSSK